jgi:hypothetical protein
MTTENEGQTSVVTTPGRVPITLWSVTQPPAEELVPTMRRAVEKVAAGMRDFGSRINEVVATMADSWARALDGKSAREVLRDAEGE